VKLSKDEIYTLSMTLTTHVSYQKEVKNAKISLSALVTQQKYSDK
jgi:hypothetical protein